MYNFNDNYTFFYKFFYWNVRGCGEGDISDTQFLLCVWNVSFSPSPNYNFDYNCNYNYNYNYSKNPLNPQKIQKKQKFQNKSKDWKVSKVWKVNFPKLPAEFLVFSFQFLLFIF